MFLKRFLIINLLLYVVLLTTVKYVPNAFLLGVILTIFHFISITSMTLLLTEYRLRKVFLFFLLHFLLLALTVAGGYSGGYMLGFVYMLGTFLVVSYLEIGLAKYLFNLEGNFLLQPLLIFIISMVIPFIIESLAEISEIEILESIAKYKVFVFVSLWQMQLSYVISSKLVKIHPPEYLD